MLTLFSIFSNFGNVHGALDDLSAWTVSLDTVFLHHAICQLQHRWVKYFNELLSP